MKKKSFTFFLENITLNKVLVAIAFFVFFIILGTTIIVKVRTPHFPIVKALPQTPAKEKFSSYKEIGQLRAVTLPQKNKANGTTVVIKPILSYTKDDQDFFEELSRKNMAIKTIFTQYFSSETAESFKKKGEAKIKNELLERLNKTFVLNKVQDIYFEELIFLD